jgi:hypothetical protein
MRITVGPTPRARITPSCKLKASSWRKRFIVRRRLQPMVPLRLAADCTCRIEACLKIDREHPYDRSTDTNFATPFLAAKNFASGGPHPLHTSRTTRHFNRTRPLATHHSVRLKVRSTPPPRELITHPSPDKIKLHSKQFSHNLVCLVRSW